MHTVYITHVFYLCCSRGDCLVGIIMDTLFISETLGSSEKFQMCMTISQQSSGRLLNRCGCKVTGSGQPGDRTYCAKRRRGSLLLVALKGNANRESV